MTWLLTDPNMAGTSWCHIVVHGVVQLMPAAYDPENKVWIWLNDAYPIVAELVTHYQPLPEFRPHA